MVNFMGPWVRSSLFVLVFLELQLQQTTSQKVFTRAGLIHFQGKKFPAEESYKEVKVYGGECKCRKKCLEDGGRCQGYCWIKFPSYITCRLTEKSKEELTWQDNPDGYSSHLYPTEYGIKYSYMFINELLTYDEAVAKCTALGNFQLGIYKTEATFAFLKQTFSLQTADTKGIWVNMAASLVAPHGTWGDGTIFEETEIHTKGLSRVSANEENSYYRFTGTKFLDRVPTVKYKVLCQEI